MHPRVCPRQIAFIGEPTSAFIDHCRAIGVQHTTLVTPLLMQPGSADETQRALAAGGTRATVVSHPFGTYPNLDQDSGQAAERMLEATGIAETLGADGIYVFSGGPGALNWEQAAEGFVELIAPSRSAAQEKGIQLLVETASDFNVDIHIAHTLDDTIVLAEIAGIGVCIDLHACWLGELKKRSRRVMPTTSLVQCLRARRPHCAVPRRARRRRDPIGAPARRHPQRPATREFSTSSCSSRASRRKTSAPPNISQSY